MKRKTKVPEMQDCFVYARYSSHAQKDTSIEDQVADIKIYCQLNNLRIVKVYADRHLSGTTDKRPQFQQMMKDAAHAGRVKYVVVWKTDRFARNRYDSATYKYRLKRYGIRVLSAKESIPEGPEGILLEAVLEGSAEYYSANLAQNIKRGIHYSALDCKVTSGSIPFGYCKGADGRFAVLEHEAEIVREIYRRVSAGEKFSEIAADLNARGLRTKQKNLWNKGSFHTMLRNEAYIGVYRRSDVRIEGGMPAIVDKIQFLEVQKKMETKQGTRGRHRDDSEYMLTGKLFCAHCGAPMIGMSGTGRHGESHYYYACQTRRTRQGVCKKKNVQRDWLERLVTQMALDCVLQPDVMAWIVDAVMRYQDRAAADAQATDLRLQLSEVEKSTSNIMKAIEAGIITATTKNRLLELEADAVRLKNDIALAEASIVHLEREQVQYWLDRFRDGDLESPDFRRKVIDTFVAAVYLSDGDLRIAFNYTGQNNEISKELVMDAETSAVEEVRLSSREVHFRGIRRTPATIYFVGPVFVLVVPLPTKR